VVFILIARIHAAKLIMLNGFFIKLHCKNEKPHI
jgi:hypothetical protein